MVNIKVSNKAVYTFIAIIILIGIIGLAYAFNPSGAGHNAGEILVTIDGNSVTLQEAINDGSIGGSATTASESGKEDPMVFVIEGTNSYGCSGTKNLENHCGDFDGCDIRLQMQNTLSSDDEVRTIDEHIYMEEDLSKNNHDGTYGWTRQEGGGDYSWITGTENRYTIFSPWEWTFMFNYQHDWCPAHTGYGNGPAFENHYEFEFMTRPHITTRVIIYD